MSETFAQMAEQARLVATSQRPGTIDYARMIARLAEALDRFEYNVAEMFAHCEPRDLPVMSKKAAISEQLGVLRRALPEETHGRR